MPEVTTISQMDLDGGAPCFDLINTALDTGKDAVVERLHRYEDVLILVRRLGLVNAKTVRALAAAAAANPLKARQTYIAALELRSTLYTVFGAIADHRLQTVDPAALGRLSGYIADALKFRQYVVKNGLLQMADVYPSNDPGFALHLFIRSADEVLRDQDPANIKRCGRCQWLFLDTTKNHRRKWCSMKECGSLEKAGRYYKRKKRERS